MKNYSEIAEEVKKLAALLFEVKDIALALDIDAEELLELLRSPGNAIHTAFHQGRLETKIKVNNSLIQLAENGSQPAINKVLEKQSLIDHELDDE